MSESFDKDDKKETNTIKNEYQSTGTSNKDDNEIDFIVNERKEPGDRAKKLQPHELILMSETSEDDDNEENKTSNEKKNQEE